MSHRPANEMTTSMLCTSLSSRKMETLTPAMLKVLSAVDALYRIHGRALRGDDVCLFLGSKYRTDYFIRGCLEKLRRQGLIHFERHRARTITPRFRFTPAEKM